jgi:hypothetical protein
MGTVTERVRKDGSKAYMAQISIICEGRHVLRENKTFDRQARMRSAPCSREPASLGIDDLHFHDLGHDGASRLFEMGSTIPQAASVSGRDRGHR